MEGTDPVGGRQPPPLCWPPFGLSLDFCTQPNLYTSNLRTKLLLYRMMFLENLVVLILRNYGCILFKKVWAIVSISIFRRHLERGKDEEHICLQPFDNTMFSTHPRTLIQLLFSKKQHSHFVPKDHHLIRDASYLSKKQAFDFDLGWVDPSNICISQVKSF